MSEERVIMPNMRYTITFEADAETPLDAAKAARPTVCTVKDRETGRVYRVDLKAQSCEQVGFDPSRFRLRRG